jgi:hypothetical protein
MSVSVDSLRERLLTAQPPISGLFSFSADGNGKQI